MSSSTSFTDPLSPPPSPSPVRRPLAAQTNTRQLIPSSKAEIEAIKATLVSTRVRRDPRALPLPRRRGLAPPAHAFTQVFEYTSDEDDLPKKFEQPSSLGLAIMGSNADFPSDDDNADSLARTPSTHTKGSNETGAGKNYRCQDFEKHRNSDSGLGLGLGVRDSVEWAEQSLIDEREAIRKVYPKSPYKAYCKAVKMKGKMREKEFFPGADSPTREQPKGRKPISYMPAMRVPAMREPGDGLGLILGYPTRSEKPMVSKSDFESQEIKQNEFKKQLPEANWRAIREEAVAGPPSGYQTCRGSNIRNLEKPDTLTDSVAFHCSPPKELTYSSSKYSSAAPIPGLQAPGIQNDDWMITSPPSVSPPPTPRPGDNCRHFSYFMPHGELPPLPLAAASGRHPLRKPTFERTLKRAFDIWLDKQELQSALRLRKSRIPFDYANYHQEKQAMRIRDVGKCSLLSLPKDEEEGELDAIDFSTPKWQFGKAPEVRMQFLLEDARETTPKNSVRPSHVRSLIRDIHYPSGSLQPNTKPTEYFCPREKVTADLFERPHTAFRSPIVNKMLDYGVTDSPDPGEGIEIGKVSHFRRGPLSEGLFEPPGGKDLWGY